MNRYRQMFEAELEARGIDWCRGECGSSKSHKRGFANNAVHLDREVATRSTLYRALHEIGHVVLRHHREHRTKRRYLREQEANTWAERRMRELGVPVPRDRVQRGQAYVARMKAWGDR